MINTNMMKKAYYSDYLYYNSSLKYSAWLLVHDNKIEGFTTETPDESYQRIIFKNSGIFPTFINSHTHLPMSLFRGLADDKPLDIWLNQYIWPMESKWLSDEFVKDATMLAAAELIRSGTGCVNDMYFFTDIMADVFINVGMRGVFGSGILDIPTTYGASTKNYLEKAQVLIDNYRNNSLINIAICPHSLYTVSPETYKEIVAFTLKNDIIMHTHLAETSWEVNEIFSRYGKRPVAQMEEIGGFGCKSIFAHCVHLNEEEIALLGEKRVNISHCLQSNMKLASGFAPMHQLMKAGANITIGTDGAASNNDQNMLQEISSVALFHKGYTQDPTAFDAETVFSCATKNAAKALWLDHTGELRKGKQADFMVVSYGSPHMQPVFNPLSHLVYTAQKSDITDLFVAGKPLLSNGRLTTIDEEAVLEKAREWQKCISAK